MDKIYRCNVTCIFRVKDNLEEYIPVFSSIIAGFKLPDGRTVRPIIGLELESNGDSYNTLISSASMARLGFDGLEYENSDFEEAEDLSEKLENKGYEEMPIENIPANLDPRFESTKAIIERRLKEMK